MIKPSKLNGYFLDLSHLNLSAVITGGLRQAHHLRGLHLSFNKLSLLPEPDLGCLTNLCFLDLSSNQLTALPAALSSLSCLIELKASRNLLTSLPASLPACLPKLESLDLAHNRLEGLPNTLAAMTALTALHLDGNPLFTVPFEVSRLKFLRHLTLEGCPLIDDVPLQLISAAHVDTSNTSPNTSSSSVSSVVSAGNSAAAAAAAVNLDSAVTGGSSKVPTLKELAARVLVRCAIPVTEECAPREVVDYLASAHSCSFCAGPYFECHVRKYKFVVRGGVSVPLESRLCCNHWTNDKDRILTLFRPAPSTRPTTLPEDRLRAIVARNSAQGGAAAAMAKPRMSSVSAASVTLESANPKKKERKLGWLFRQGKSNKKAARKSSASSHQSSAAPTSALSSTPSLSRRRKASTAEAGQSPSGGSNSHFTRMEFVDEQRHGLRRSPSSQ